MRYIQNPKERHKIDLACHAHPTSGHFGVKKTIARVEYTFTWKGVVEAVKNIVSNSVHMQIMRFHQYVVVNSVVMQVSTCDLCQRMNSKLTTATPELHLYQCSHHGCTWEWTLLVQYLLCAQREIVLY